MALQVGDIAPDLTAETTEGRLSVHDYPAAIGRNAEFLRVLDALQLSSECRVSTPVSWNGDQVIISSHDDATEGFPQGSPG